MIEKVFHQIWINSENPEMPDRFKVYRDTWLSCNPGWEYKLWNLDNLDFEPRCASLLSQCQNPAQMADLLRMEIIYRYGGVYIDTDFECLRPLDEILTDVSTFVCSEDGKYISIGIFGSESNSELFKLVIDSFPNSLGHEPVNIETGPVFFTNVILKNGFKNNLTLFPTNFFYPFNYHARDRANADLSQSYGVHHYADSWKLKIPIWKRFLGRLKL